MRSGMVSGFSILVAVTIGAYILRLFPESLWLWRAAPIWLAALCGTVVWGGQRCAARFAAPVWAMAPLLCLWLYRPGAGAVYDIGILPLLLAGSCVGVFRALCVEPRPPPRWLKPTLAVVWALYGVVFCAVAARQTATMSFLNAQDFAIYNQSFWNSLHGRWFQNSTYGSNFACHNSVFFFLLVPVYALIPYPLTLLAVKSLLVPVAAMLFFNWSLPLLGWEAATALSGVFLFYPHMIGLHFCAPHEMCFAPVLIMLTYFAYRRQRWGWFVVWLTVSLSVKEHLSLLALAYGALSWYHRRSLRWRVWPVILGLGWAGLSVIVLRYFQSRYHSPAAASWLLDQWARTVHSGFFGQSAFCRLVSLIFSGGSRLLLPLGMIIPFGGVAWMLAVPEIFIVASAGRSVLFSPQWHYVLWAVPLLVLSTAEAIPRVSGVLRRGVFAAIPQERLISALSWMVFAAVAAQSYQWAPILSRSAPDIPASAIRQALARIGPAASVGVPPAAAVAASGRVRYELLQADMIPTADYLIVDESTRRISAFRHPSGYVPAWRNPEVTVWRRDLCGRNNSGIAVP